MTVMPSASFHHLSDSDLNNLTAYIRSKEQGDGPELDVSVGPVARLLIWNRAFTPQAEQVQTEAPWIDEADQQSEHATGRYLALTVCGECHGLDLKGTEGFSPGLAAAVAYSREDFGRLMKEGKPIGQRELSLMREVAISRFSHMSDEEVDALYGYLKTLTSVGP
jgi:mono/diheme cytochrome c family protein